jgi:Flp pilus assembly protein TadD
MSEQSTLARAYALLRSGRLVEAEHVCRSLLAGGAQRAAATHLLAMVRRQAGDAESSERLMRESIALEPRNAEFRTNFGNFLRHLGKLAAAEEAYRAALALESANRVARLGLTRTLGDLGRHAQAESEASALVAIAPRDAQAWSALAMAQRNQGRLADAERTYRKAIAIDPGYGLAHHNLGSLLVGMERAEEALAALRKAASCGVGGYELAFNYGRTFLMLYRFDEAEQAFAEAVALAPHNTDAQINLARTRFMRGDPDFARDITAAAHATSDPRLKLVLGIVLRRAGDYPAAEQVLTSLLAEHGAFPEARSALASVLHETGRLEAAEREVMRAVDAAPDDVLVIENAVAILLARGRADRPMPLIRTRRSRQPEDQGWLAYEASAARLLGEDGYRELYDYGRLVRVFDLEPPPGWTSMAAFNADLLTALTSRHRLATHPLDQSLRHGSQTARNLLQESDEVIRAALAAFASPIDAYRRENIGTDAAHPLSARNLGPTTIHAAWSVQLRREGFHVNHFHPEGWISSAYYVSVPPETLDDATRSGWIKFGEARFPAEGAGPERYVQPRAGRLVLFPSYMWHGTTPIHGDEARTTIAFDAVPPALRE